MAGEQKKQPKRQKKSKKEEAQTPRKAMVVAKAEKEKEEQTALIGEAVEKMPPEVRRIFQGFAATFSSQISGSRSNPLFEKFTPEHIDKYLDYIQRDDDHEHELKKTNRNYYLIYALVALGAFIAGVVYLLERDRDLLIQLIVSSSRKGLNMVYLALTKETKEPCSNLRLKITETYDLHKC